MDAIPKHKERLCHLKNGMAFSHSLTTGYDTYYFVGLRTRLTKYPKTGDIELVFSISTQNDKLVALSVKEYAKYLNRVYDKDIYFHTPTQRGIVWGE